MKTNRKPTSTWWAAETKNPVHSPSHGSIRRPVRSVALGASVLTAIWLPAQIASAQAVYYDRPLSQLIEQMEPLNPPTGVNGTRWITRGDANAAVDLANNNTISWFTIPPFFPQNLNWQDGGYEAQFEYNVFTSQDSTRRNLFLQHQDLGSDTPREVTWTIRQATFENVTFDPTVVHLLTTGRGDGTSPTSWTLINAKFIGGGRGPRVAALDPFTLTVSGTERSELFSFPAEASIGAPTTLLVKGAGGLSLSQCGDANGGNGSVFKYAFSNPLNTYDINGSTLSLEGANVLFNSGRTPTVTNGTVTEGFVVRNGGTLSLSGITPGYTRMKIQDSASLWIDQSTLSLENNATLDLGAGGTFRVSNGVIKMGTGGTLTRIFGTDASFSGTSQIHTSSADPNYCFSTGIILEDASTVLNINGNNVNGSGIVVADGVGDEANFPMNGGTININDRAVFRLGRMLHIRTSGSLNIGKNAYFSVDSSGYPQIPTELYLEDAAGNPLVISNNGYIQINDTLVGKGSIAGPGILQVDGLLKFATGESSFTVAGDFWLKGKLRLLLDPTAGSAQHVNVKGLTLGEVFNGIPLSLPTLSLSITKDQILSVGTKFLLIDYVSRNSNDEIFSDLSDGQVFQLGLNTYQIRYSDADYGAANGGNSSVVTLTVVANSPPTPGGDDLARPATTRVSKVLQSVLLSNDTDLDNNPLTITAVGNALPAGATVALSGNFVVYTAPAADAGDGSFEYTVSDGPGGRTTTGHVVVHQVAPTGSGPNTARIVKAGSDVVLTFIGVPGRNYRLQYTISGSPPYVWNDFSPVVTLRAPDSGVFTSTDINPPNPLRLYRAVLNP